MKQIDYKKYVGYSPKGPVPMLLNACKERDDKIAHVCTIINKIITGGTKKDDVHHALIALHLHLTGESND